MAFPQDFTRWNRAGLSRLRYVDGNAATYLDLLRTLLADRFPAWAAVQSAAPEDETETERIERMEAQYQATPADPIGAVMRTFARSCHILGEYIDACANEHTLGTATQWEHLRRLVEMLDYHPRPPASAYTSIVLTAKDGVTGTVAKGFQVKSSPADGSAPLVFETLEDVDVDAALNALRPSGYNRSPAALSGDTLVLEEAIGSLKTGEPLVLEDERTGVYKAYLIQGLLVTDTTTTITVSPSLPATFAAGYTVAHVAPQDHLTPISPVTTGAQIKRGLQLDGSSSDLQAGEVVMLSVTGKKPLFRRIRFVEETRLVFTEDVGDLDLANAQVSRPFELAVAQQGKRTVEDGAVLNTVYAAGDWTRLVGTWVADERFAGGKRVLPVYQVTSVKYVPPVTAEDALEDDDKPGFSAITIRWAADEDAVDTSVDLSPRNPQSLLVTPVSPGPWRPDTYLEKSNDGHLPTTIVTSQPKKTAAGDLAVIVRGSTMAWAELAAVEVDLDAGTAGLRATSGWTDRGGAPFYRSLTTVHAHFKTQARLLGWDTNSTPLSGTEVPVDSIPSALVKGRAVMVTTAGSALATEVAGLDTSSGPPRIQLADAVPADATYDTLTLSANVVPVGHGETMPRRVIGSGDATKSSQSFVVAVDGVSFIPDSTASSGVRADIQVVVDGQTWEQVDSLNDAGPTDTHYTARMTEDGYVELGFGDGTNGRRLPTGTSNVRGALRRGTGSAGNLAANSLTKAVKPHALVKSVAQPIAASGGADMEGAEALRTGAPATVLTLGRAVSVQDFAALVRSHASVAEARAFAQKTGRGRSDSIEVVVVPAGGGAFTSELESTLEAFALAGAAPGVAVTVSAYEPVLVSFTVTVRVNSKEYDLYTVAADVEASLKSAFALGSRELGQALYIAALFQVVEAVTGVQSSDCAIGFDPSGQALSVQPRLLRGEDGTIRAIRPAERQCIHLDATSPQVTVTVEEVTS